MKSIFISLGGKLTDISGNDLYYGADTQIANGGGVLATPHWVNHQVGFIVHVTYFSFILALFWSPYNFRF